MDNSTCKLNVRIFNLSPDTHGESNWPSLKSDKMKVRFLHVEADEDHVHQQKGKGMIMKLTYVHESKGLVNYFSATKNHGYELIGAQYMTGLLSEE